MSEYVEGQGHRTIEPDVSADALSISMRPEVDNVGEVNSLNGSVVDLIVDVSVAVIAVINASNPEIPAVPGIFEECDQPLA